MTNLDHAISLLTRIHEDLNGRKPSISTEEKVNYLKTAKHRIDQVLDLLYFPDTTRGGKNIIEKLSDIALDIREISEKRVDCVACKIQKLEGGEGEGDQLDDIISDLHEIMNMDMERVEREVEDLKDEIEEEALGVKKG